MKVRMTAKEILSLMAVSNMFAPDGIPHAAKYKLGNIRLKCYFRDISYHNYCGPAGRYHTIRRHVAFGARRTFECLRESDIQTLPELYQ